MKDDTTNGTSGLTRREVIKTAFDDMYLDTYMIRKHRKLINRRKHQAQ